MKNLNQIIQIIEKNKNFLVTMHVNPDPDALCSVCAIAIYLRRLGKKVVMVNEDKIQLRYHFLPATHQIKSYEECQGQDYDVAIILDCGDLGRIGKVQGLLQKGKPVINIDHHITNTKFGKFNLVASKASSTCEVVYDLLMEAKFGLTKELAMYLYGGIMTDTGCFRYSNTVARTHEIASELRGFNFSATDLYRNFYETSSLDDIKEFTKVIRRFDMLFEKRVVCLELTKRMLKKFSEDFDLRDSIFTFFRAIKSIEVLVIFTESENNKTRVNLRSAGTVNVAKVAASFQGGGHHNAAGCTLDGDMKQVRSVIIKKIGKAL